MKIIDAHSHIDYITHDFQPDVVGTCCCTTDESQWGILGDMMARDNRIYGAFGTHPWFAEDIVKDFDVRLESLLKSNRLFMVGEIGLDKYKPDMEKQLDVFVRQLEIAIRLKRTVFIHCVGAWDKLLHILKQYKQSELPMIVFHSFNGNGQIMQSLLDNYNVIFSFSKNALYDRNCRIEQIPLDKILVETDGNKDVNLIDIISQIAKIKCNANAPEIIYNNTWGILNNG